MSLVSILGIVLAILILATIVLSLIYLKMYLNENNGSKTDKSDQITNKQNVVYNTKSIFDFMEFDKIEDNMIVQKNRKKILNGC